MQGEGDVRVTPAPVAEHRGEQGDGEALRAADPQRPGPGLSDRPGGPDGGGGRLDRPPGVSDRDPPRGGEPDPACLATQQGRARLPFQRGDLVGHGRLRGVQQQGGLSDRSGVRDRDEAFQRAK